jgi:hypothetical protein
MYLFEINRFLNRAAENTILCDVNKFFTDILASSTADTHLFSVAHLCAEACGNVDI